MYNENIILNWADDNTDHEEWFVIKSDRKLIDAYFNIEITLYELMKKSQVFKVKRFFKTYSDITYTDEDIFDQNKISEYVMEESFSFVNYNHIIKLIMEN